MWTTVVISDLPTWTSDLSAGLLVLVFAIGFAENAIGLGLLLPGELVIAALGVTSADLTTTLAIGAAAAAGAVAGDHVGYLFGRRWATRLRRSRPIRRLGEHRWSRVESAIARNGFLVIVAGRCLPGIRTLVPVVAGTAKVRLRTFSLASVAGGLLWTTWWVGAGAGLGVSASKWGGTAAIVAVLVCACLALLIRRQLNLRVARASAEAAPSTGETE